jgi:integrase
MARVAERLTVRTIALAKAVDRPKMLADGKGLLLRIGPSGSKSWIFRYVSNGRRHDMGLGPYPDISLAEARELATVQRKLRLAGTDPLAAKRSLRASQRLSEAKLITFKECAERYIDAHSAGWRDLKTLSQWQASLTAYVYPIFGNLPVQMIDVGLVMRVLEPIWRDKTETASRVRGRIESVLDWATARGYRRGENPARWRGHLDKLLPARSKVRKVEHFKALPYAEIAGFMVELRDHKSVSARALEFAILTAARVGEAIGARWDEINLAEGLWTISDQRMKAGREHRVPLSEEATAVLRQMQELRTGDFVFPGQNGIKPIGDVAVWRLLRTMGRGDLTTHGFRSSFRDWAAERTNFPREVAELALAHQVGDATERAYQRGDLFQKRRQLMQAWSKFCDSPAGEAGEKIIAIGR